MQSLALAYQINLMFNSISNTFDLIVVFEMFDRRTRIYCKLFQCKNVIKLTRCSTYGLSLILHIHFQCKS